MPGARRDVGLAVGYVVEIVGLPDRIRIGLGVGIGTGMGRRIGAKVLLYTEDGDIVIAL
ncbi:MAG: hypothetical protein ACJ0UT_05240 [Candidatus Latescibacterota bacterium]